MSFWPQQLNFALWCATTGSGISREFLQSEGDNSSLNLSPQLRSFYLFHVYSQQDAYCMRWAEFRALALCQATPHLTGKTTHTTRSPTEGFAQDSTSILALTFASRSAKTTALAMYL